MKKILFRVDFSSSIGFGHIMRCLVLAREFGNSKIFFASYNAQDCSIVTSRGYEFINLLSDDIENLVQIIKQYDISLTIIDSYNIGYEEEKVIKMKTTSKLMVLDDVYEKHFCDLLLNHNIYADKKMYKGQVPSFCKLKCGKKYTLIRDEFKHEKNKKRDKKGVFVSLGGSDAKNLTLEILKKLPSNLKVRVATTSANKNIEALARYAEENDNVALHVNSKKIAKLMNKSLFGIISPSVMAHEALFLKLPFIAIKTAENQKYMYRYLKNRGITCVHSLEDLDMKKMEKYIKGRFSK